MKNESFFKALIVAQLICSSSVFAAAKFKSEGAVQALFQVGSPAKIQVQVQSGFHINEKAPNKVIVLAANKMATATKLDAKSALFLLPQLSAQDQVKASIYVCDDALTVCEERTWIWDAKGQIVNAVAASATSVKKEKIVIKHGFIQNSLDTALQDCKTSHKSVMLLFSAPWCPGCLRMEQEIWTSARMKPALDLFSKVKMDADIFVNKALMEKYEVAGIPTTLILNCNGEELERFVDYQTPSIFKQGLEEVAKNKDLPTHAELAKKAEAGDAEAATILAKRAASTGASADALKWYSHVPNAKDQAEYWGALTFDQYQKNEKSPSEENKKKFAEVLNQALQKFPETPSALDWRSQLADLQNPESKEGQKTLQDLVKLCDELIQDPARMIRFNQSEPAGDYQGIETLRVYEAKAEALEALKKPDEEKKAWNEAAAEGDRLKIKDEISGPFYRFLPILKKANQDVRVQNFFDKSLAKNPKDPDLLRRYAKYLYEQKEYKKSTEFALKALVGSYDRNEIFAAIVYAKSLAKLGKPDQAKEFLLKYQSRPDLSASSRTEIDSTLSQIK